MTDDNAARLSISTYWMCLFCVGTVCFSVIQLETARPRDHEAVLDLSQNFVHRLKL